MSNTELNATTAIAPRPTQTRLRRWVAILLLALISYPLSFGPAAVLAVRGGELPAMMFLAFYLPLNLIAKQTGTEEAFGAYGKWCIDVTVGDPRHESLQ